MLSSQPKEDARTVYDAGVRLIKAATPDTKVHYAEGQGHAPDMKRALAHRRRRGRVQRPRDDFDRLIMMWIVGGICGALHVRRHLLRHHLGWYTTVSLPKAEFQPIVGLLYVLPWKRLDAIGAVVFIAIARRGNVYRTRQRGRQADNARS